MEILEHSGKLPCPSPALEELRTALLQIRNNILEGEKAFGDLDQIHPRHRNSARNLLQYLALRKRDIRPVQYQLTDWGLSSLGRSERKVQATVDTVLHLIHALEGLDWNPEEAPPVCFEEGRRLLEDNSEALFGEKPESRRARIMVTMPSAAANNYRLIHDLLENGMNIARVNCAHDDPDVWLRIIENVRRAEKSTGRPCLIHMDLGGPKLRTGEILPGNAVLKVSPARNEFGELTRPAVVWLVPEENAGAGEWAGKPVLPVPEKWLSNLETGDVIRFQDARKSSRKIRITAVLPEGCIGALRKTAYFVPGISLKPAAGNHRKKRPAASVGKIPQKENFLLLEAENQLILKRNQEPGSPAVFDKSGQLVSPACIGVSLPEVLNDVEIGEPIWFDDGKIGGIIEEIREEEVAVRITYALNGGVKLRKEKGINLPDTNLRLSALTEQDLEDLKFAVLHADTIGMSFANGPEDVHQLIRELRKLTGTLPGIILKIETARGFHHLPDMLLAAMEIPNFGVMIARGDLAIEVGFGRLAELQEEILWICEAAHVPVIWATQVLEELAKTGVHTRAEVTDAAMGQRAECIMLNKGDHIVTATRALTDILQRMQDHQTKKRSTHRKLRLAERFFERIKANTAVPE